MKPLLVASFIVLVLIAVYLYRIFPWMRIHFRKPDVIFVLGFDSSIVEIIRKITGKEYELRVIEDSDDCYPYHKRLCLFIINHESKAIDVYEKFKKETKEKQSIPVLFMGRKDVEKVQLEQWRNRGHDFMYMGTGEDSIDEQMLFHRVSCLIGKRRPYPLPQVGKSFLGKYKIQEDIERNSVYHKFKGSATENNVPVGIYFLPSEYWLDDIKKRLRGLVDLAEKEDFTLFTILDSENNSHLRCFVISSPPGVSLREVMEKEEKLSPEQCKTIILRLARGLKVAHKMDLHHGSIHPKNILFPYKVGSQEPDLSTPLLFGFDFWPKYKKLVGADLISTTKIAKNTWELKSFTPEQMQITPTKAGNDLYSLGALILMMLEGKGYKGKFHNTSPNKEEVKQNFEVEEFEKVSNDNELKTLARNLMELKEIVIV